MKGTKNNKKLVSDSLKMGQSFFDFKQFRINQDKCGMKVSTEACILGAYAYFNSPAYILDIGTGTGLLALMMAQKYPTSFIDAVELDPQAAHQAHENVTNSIYKTRISVIQNDIELYAQSSEREYDAIICNPPFYNNHLLSGNQQKNWAKHTQKLTQESLLQALQHLLSGNGVFWALLPPPTMKEFIKYAMQANFFLHHQLEIYHSPSHPLFRKITAFGRQKLPYTEDILYIRTQSGAYSDKFVQLLKNFYLIF